MKFAFNHYTLTAQILSNPGTMYPKSANDDLQDTYREKKEKKKT